MAGGLNHSTELQTLLRERQAIEAKYHKALAKLYSTHKSSSRDRPLAPAWCSLLSELGEKARVHATLATQLAEVNSKVSSVTSAFEAQSRTFVAEGSKSIKSLQSAYNAVKKASASVESTSHELSETQSALKRAQANHKAKSKELAKLEKKCGSLEARVAEAGANLEEKEKASHTQQSVMLGLLDIFQETSNVFNGQFRDLYAALAVDLAQAAVEGNALAQQMRSEIEAIDAREELREFVVEMADESDAASRVSVMSLVNPTVKGRLVLKTQDDHVRKFKEYFCVYMESQSRLYWFAHEAASEPVGSVVLTPGPYAILPLHPTLYGQSHAFHVKTPDITLHMYAPTRIAASAWIKALRQTTIGTSAIDKMERSGGFAQSLTLTLSELKGLSKQGEYYVLVSLDDNLVARSSTTEVTNKPIWDDKIHLPVLPLGIDNIVLDVYKDKHTTKGDKLRGGCVIPLKSLTPNVASEQWVDCEFASDPGSEGRLRIKTKHTILIVRPLAHYTDLVETFAANPAPLVAFCETIPVALREVAATHLVNIFHTRGDLLPFIHSLIQLEISSTSDPGIIFRGNSLTTKAIDIFMKMVGMEYLHTTLEPVISAIYACKTSCEVDGVAGNDSALRKAWKLLNGFIVDAWNAIAHSPDACPAPMVSVFNGISRAVAHKWPEPEHENVRFIAVSGFLFLRFFVPAIISPKSFDLGPDHPSKMTTRTLTLVAKTIQNLGNLVQFGKKEPYMSFANDFITENIPSIKSFIDAVSSLSANPALIKIANVDAESIPLHAAGMSSLLHRHRDKIQGVPDLEVLLLPFASPPLSQPFLPEGMSLPPPPPEDQSTPPAPAAASSSSSGSSLSAPAGSGALPGPPAGPPPDKLPGPPAGPPPPKLPGPPSTPPPPKEPKKGSKPRATTFASGESASVKSDIASAMSKKDRPPRKPKVGHAATLARGTLPPKIPPLAATPPPSSTRRRSFDGTQSSLRASSSSKSDPSLAPPPPIRPSGNPALNLGAPPALKPPSTGGGPPPLKPPSTAAAAAGPPPLKPPSTAP